MKVERLHLRLFLEGIEIPCVSISVSMRRNAAATAVIQIVPTPLAHFILPRTIVHCFYADDTVPRQIAASPSASTVTQATNAYQAPENTGRGTVTPPVVPDEYLRYRLLFTGEVVGLQYVKRASQRAVILQCADLSNYWDSVLHDRRGGLFPPTREAHLSGSAQGGFWDLLGGDTGQIYDIMTKPPSFFPELNEQEENGARPGGKKASYMGAIMHLMETVFGTYHRREADGDNVIGSQNPFAAMAELRLRLLQQVGVPPKDSSPIKLLRAQGFGSIWRRSVRGLPAQFSFRTLMQALMQYTFYSTFPLTTPKYKPPEGVFAEAMGWSRLEPSPEAREERSSSQTRADRMLTELRAQLTAVRNLQATAEATPMGQPIANGIETTSAVGNKANELQGQIPDSLTRTSDVWQQVKTSLIFLRDMIWHPRASVYYAAWVRSVGDQINGVMNLLKQLSGSRWRREGLPESVQGMPAFLYTQLMSPDVWFCAPPRCNVIFPEFVSSVQTAKNFLMEPTRLLVQGYSAFFGSDPFFDRYYFAPTTVGLLRERPITRSGSSVAEGNYSIKNDLMAHELFTGIIPAFQKMSDREMTIGKEIAGVGRGSDQYMGEAMDYFQRVTNFIFFKTRFASRALSVSGVFNPYLVPGYPALVIDAPTDALDTTYNDDLLRTAQEQLRDVPEAQQSDLLGIIRGRTGVHHLGLVETLTHTLDASGGGTTDVTLSYARDHRESVEYYGADAVEAHRRRRVYREAHRRLTQQEEQRLREAQGDYVHHLQYWAQEINTRGFQAGMDVHVIQANYQLQQQLAALGQMGQILQGTISREIVTDKVWRVAVYNSPPQEGGVGPWGGPITRVREITDEYASGRFMDTRSRRELERVQREIDRVSTEIANYEERRRMATTDADRATLDTTLRSLYDEKSQYEAKRSTIIARATPNSSRLLPLYGTYGDGRRLPQASIPAHLIGTAHPAREFGPDVQSLVGDPTGHQLVTLRAFELVEDISEGASKVDLPVEAAVRPPWYPEIWDNDQIGGAVYLPLLGTSAICDPMAIMRPDTLTSIPSRQATAVQGVFEDASGGGTSPEVIGSILSGTDVQGAVDFLVHTYSQIRNSGFDVAEFARQYVYRSVANIFDMFGSADLELSSDGKITQGIEGFHSRAFGPFTDLFGIAPADTTKLLGIEADDAAARARLDVRGQRHGLILTYQQELRSRLLMREDVKNRPPNTL